jgi:hypothetical protein
MFSDVDFDNKKKINGLDLAMETDFTDSDGTYFLNDGIYTYSISVYNCDTLDEQLNTSGCGAGSIGDKNSEMLLGFQQFKRGESKIITVTGSKKSECSTNLDCPRCSGCVGGMQTCFINELGARCMDCFTDSMCNTTNRTYSCYGNECILKN